MMFRVDKFWKKATNNLKCILKSKNIISSQSVQFVRYFQITTTQRNNTVAVVKKDIIANFCQTFNCSEDSANKIYEKFPSLRSIDAIQNDTLDILRSKLSAQSIVENPTLVTMNNKILTRKIELVEKLKPKKLDDFAPLLKLDTNELDKLIGKLKKEEHLIEQKNRIYFLSERLQIEPKEISAYRANCGYEIFFSSFRSFKKKLNVVLDYGVKPLDILNGLYAFRRDDSLFVRRAERLISMGLPIKMWHFLQSENGFDSLLNNYAVKKRKRKDILTLKRAEVLKKRNLEKAVIVETLKSLLNCDDSESSEIHYNYVNGIQELNVAKSAVKYLLKSKISLRVIKENGFLLSMSKNEIEEKLKVLRKMKSKSIEDFVPLMQMESTELLTDVIGREELIYYFSEQLNIPAAVVVAHMIEHKDIFFKLGNNLLKHKLDILVKHHVDPMSILNCKTTFLMGSKSIEKIINDLKNNGIEKIMSWMIIHKKNPSYDTLISTHLKEVTSLEGCQSTIEYITHRLNLDESSLQYMLEKYPSLPNYPASKAKEKLDYLLTIFKADDIVDFPHIFSTGIDKIKTRVEEMNKLGVPITLQYIYQNDKRHLSTLKKYSVNSSQNVNSQAILEAIELRMKSKKSKNTSFK